MYDEPAVLVPGIGGVRAAQYVRMSTDMQKYSIANQCESIAAYAAQRHLEIVRSYIDEGRSGLTANKRSGLKDLIRDVESGRADYDCILVYDVSRWGRFQDVDESAYYEFICRRAGINIHYCADEFENDGSLSSIILKNVKRVSAADYSRQLSRKVFMGQSHVASLGFWRGGPAGFGLRRQMIEESGKPKAILEHGQQKWFKGDRIILVPGPPEEQRVVRRIFRDFAIKKKSRTEIANELNAEGICNARGRPWSMQTIDDVLRNEKYIGHNIYNRRSCKLAQKAVANPPEMWIRHENAFKGIVSPDIFARAQTVLAELERGRKVSDQELLDRLRALLRRKGRLTMKLMQAAEDVPDWTVYARRFGSIMNAYKLIGYEAKPRYSFRQTGAKISSIIVSAADTILKDFKRIGLNPEYLPELNLITFDNRMTVIIAVAWSVADGMSKGRRSRRWQVRQIKYERSDLVLVVRMDEANASIQDYFLVPTLKLPDRKKLVVSNRHFSEFRLDRLHEVLSKMRQSVLGSPIRLTARDIVGGQVSQVTAKPPRVSSIKQVPAKTRARYIRSKGKTRRAPG